jgi:hypothetical protein
MNSNKKGKVGRSLKPYLCKVEITSKPIVTEVLVWSGSSTRDTLLAKINESIRDSDNCENIKLISSREPEQIGLANSGVKSKLFAQVGGERVRIVLNEASADADREEMKEQKINALNGTI